jgi:predicted transcriptional regulator
MKKEDKEIEGNLNILKEHIRAIDNPHRRKILDLCNKERKTMAELSRLLNSSKKVTWENIKILERATLVKLDKRLHEKYQPVYVESLLTSNDVLLSMGALAQVVVEERSKRKKPTHKKV